MPIFFNSQCLPQFPAAEYVAWIDVMGIQSAMGRSLHISGNFVFKLHVAALQAWIANVTLYPIMDGFYASSANQSDMLNFLRQVFEETADEFVQESEPLHRFVIRGALAFGPVIHGNQVTATASNIFKNKSGYKDSILLGLPMVQAHESENQAPPFGLFVHESARSFAPPNVQPMHHVWWKWVNAPNTNLWQQMQNALVAHYQWCRANSESLLYPPDRIEIHKELASQYFT
jgi:hypothetical protein